MPQELSEVTRRRSTGWAGAVGSGELRAYGEVGREYSEYLL